MRGTCRSGTVFSVDPAAGTVRLKLGPGTDAEFLSGPIQYSQTAGSLKLHNPPSVGQQMIAMSPSGDLRNAVAMPMGFSDGNSSPSGAGDQHVLTLGAVTITLKDDGVTISSGGSTVVIDGAGLSINGGAVEHNGTNIGDDHQHSGVVPGVSETGEPV